VGKDLFYIVDAGSTKTDLAIVNDDSVTIKTFKGFNPNSSDFSTINELKFIFGENRNIYFYGSGLSNENNKNLVAKEFSSNYIQVYSDVLGAARALLSQNKGLISIMGTGGVVAFYDGKTIVETKGGYGYLIDDLGGGIELAKNVVSKWLNNELSQESSLNIYNFFGTLPSQFIASYYLSKDKQKLAQLCKILPQLIQTDKQLENLIIDYFDLFIKKHISLLANKHGFKKINSLGSIALSFKELFEIALNQNNLELENVLDKPILKLVEFHKSQK
jgi:N-acetylglucosamine kinase-like BadF-type ATPase